MRWHLINIMVLGYVAADSGQVGLQAQIDNNVPVCDTRVYACCKCNIAIDAQNCCNSVSGAWYIGSKECGLGSQVQRGNYEQCCKDYWDTSSCH